MSQLKLLSVTTSDAKQIGKLYAEARRDALNSVQLLIECGQRLKKQKDTMKRGQWLPWLKENEKALGFGARTADRLIKGSNSTLTTNLKDESEAIALSRQIWGNTAASHPKKKKSSDWKGEARFKLMDWLRAELNRWPENHRDEAAHFIRQVLKEFGL